MPAPSMPRPSPAERPTGPTPPPERLTGPTPPPGRITMWKSETGDRWLAFMRWGSFQTALVRDTREKAYEDMRQWWILHTAEGKAAEKDVGT